MDQYIAYSNDLIEKLASTHNDFFNAEFEYKRELARMVLQKVQSDKWTYTNNWIHIYIFQFLFFRLLLPY